MDWFWFSIATYALIVEGYLFFAQRGTLTERVRRGRHQAALRIGYLAFVAALYFHFFHGWLG